MVAELMILALYLPHAAWVREKTAIYAFLISVRTSLPEPPAAAISGSQMILFANYVCVQHYLRSMLSIFCAGRDF